MKIYENGKVAGKIDLGDDAKIDTKNDELAKVLEYATANPLPLRSGYKKDDVFVSTVTEVGLGDNNYQQALGEFLAGYGYYLSNE